MFCIVLWSIYRFYSKVIRSIPAFSRKFGPCPSPSSAQTWFLFLVLRLPDPSAQYFHVSRHPTGLTLASKGLGKSQDFIKLFCVDPQQPFLNVHQLLLNGIQMCFVGDLHQFFWMDHFTHLALLTHSKIALDGKGEILLMARVGYFRVVPTHDNKLIHDSYERCLGFFSTTWAGLFYFNWTM